MNFRSCVFFNLSPEFHFRWNRGLIESGFPFFFFIYHGEEVQFCSDLRAGHCTVVTHPPNTLSAP